MFYFSETIRQKLCDFDYFKILETTEAVVQRCSVKKVFLEISQNSQNFAKCLQLY